MKLRSKVSPLFIGLSLLVACGKDVTPPPSSSGITSLDGLRAASGNFRLIATDAPFSYLKVASAKVTVNRIEVKSSSDISTSLVGQPLVLDLVKLTNGLVTPIIDLNLPPGQYKELNLIIETGSIDLVSGAHYNLKIPSGTSSGLKIKIDPPVNITTQASTDIILDFDLAKSFVPQGDAKDESTINGFHFKPTLRAANRTTAGSVSGKVLTDMGTASSSDDVALGGAVITIKQNGVEFAAGISDAQGAYKIIALPEGSYTVEVSSAGYTTSTPVNVSIVAGNLSGAGETLLNMEMTPVTVTP